MSLVRISTDSVLFYLYVLHLNRLVLRCQVVLHQSYLYVLLVSKTDNLYVGETPSREGFRDLFNFRF